MRHVGPFVLYTRRCSRGLSEWKTAAGSGCLPREDADETLISPHPRFLLRSPTDDDAAGAVIVERLAVDVPEGLDFDEAGL